MAKPTDKKQKPEIVLKNIKHAASLSRETYAYTATVYVDGKRLYAVSNDGHGGGDMISPATRGGAMDWQAYRELEKRIGATYPKWGGKFADDGVDDMDQNLEMVCHDLVTDWLIRKDLKSQLRRKLTYIRDGQVYECSGKLKVADIPRIRKMATWAKDVVFLNEMPFEEALKAWRKAGEA